MSRSNPNPYRPRHSHPTNGLSLIPQHVLNPVTPSPPVTRRPAIDPFKAFTARDLDSFVDNITIKIRSALLGPTNPTQTTEQQTHSTRSTRTSDVFGRLQSVHIPAGSSSSLHPQPLRDDDQPEDLRQPRDENPSTAHHDQPILISSPNGSPNSSPIGPTSHPSNDISQSEDDLSASDSEDSSEFNHQQESVDSSNEESPDQAQPLNRLPSFERPSSHEEEVQDSDSDEVISIDESTHLQESLSSLSSSSQSQQTSSGSEHLLDASPSNQITDGEQSAISISESIELTSKSSSVYPSPPSVQRTRSPVDQNDIPVRVDQDEDDDLELLQDDTDSDGFEETDSEAMEVREYNRRQEEEATTTEDTDEEEEAEAELTEEEEETEDSAQEEEDIVVDTQPEQVEEDLVVLDQEIPQFESLDEPQTAPRSPHEAMDSRPASPVKEHSEHNNQIITIPDLSNDAQHPPEDHLAVDDRITQIESLETVQPQVSRIASEHSAEHDRVLDSQLEQAGDDLAVDERIPQVKSLDEAQTAPKSPHGTMDLRPSSPVNEHLENHNQIITSPDLANDTQHLLVAHTGTDQPLADPLDNDPNNKNDGERVSTDDNHQPSLSCPPTTAIQLETSLPDDSSANHFGPKIHDSHTESLINDCVSSEPTPLTNLVKKEEVSNTIKNPSSPHPNPIITSENDDAKKEKKVNSSSSNAVEPQSVSTDAPQEESNVEEEMVEDDNDLFEGDNDLRLHNLGVNHQLSNENHDMMDTEEQLQDRFSVIEQQVQDFLDSQDHQQQNLTEDEESCVVEKDVSRSAHSMIVEKCLPEPTPNEDQPMSTETQQVPETNGPSAQETHSPSVDTVAPLTIAERPELASITHGLAEQKPATDITQVTSSSEMEEGVLSHVSYVETSQPSPGVTWGELAPSETLDGAETFMKEVNFFPLNNQSQSEEKINSAGWIPALSADISIDPIDLNSQSHSSSTVSLKLPQLPSPRQIFNLDDNAAPVAEDIKVPESTTNEAEPMVTETEQAPETDAPIADAVAPLAIFQHPQLLSINNGITAQEPCTDTTENVSSGEIEEGTVSHPSHVETDQPPSGVVWGELSPPETPIVTETFMKEVKFSPLNNQPQSEETNHPGGWTPALTINISHDQGDVNPQLSTAPTFSLKLPQPPGVRRIFNLDDDSSSVAADPKEDLCQNLKPVKPHEPEDFAMLASSITDGNSDVAPAFCKETPVLKEKAQRECSKEGVSTIPCHEENLEDPETSVNEEIIMPHPSLQSSEVPILPCESHIDSTSALKTSDNLSHDPNALPVQSVLPETHEDTQSPKVLSSRIDTHVDTAPSLQSPKVAFLTCDSVDSASTSETSDNLSDDPDALLAQFLDPADAQHENMAHSRASASPVASVMPTSAVTFAASPPTEMEDTTLIPAFAPQTPLTSTTRERGTSSESSERFMSRGSASLVTYSAPSSVVSSDTASVPASSAPPPPLPNASMGAPTEAVGLSNQITRRSSVDSSTHAEPPSPSTSTRQRSAPITQEQVNAPGLPHAEVIEATNSPRNDLPDPLRSPPLMNQRLISNVPQPISISTSRTSSMVAHPPSPSFSTLLEGSVATPGLRHRDPSLPSDLRVQLPDPNSAPAPVSIPEIKLEDVPIPCSSIEKNSSENSSAPMQVETSTKIEKSSMSAVPPPSSPKKIDSTSSGTKLPVVDQANSSPDDSNPPLSLKLPVSPLDPTPIVSPPEHNLSVDQTDKNVDVSSDNHPTESHTCGDQTSSHQKDAPKLLSEAPLETPGGNNIPDQISPCVDSLDAKPDSKAEVAPDQVVDDSVDVESNPIPEGATNPSENTSPAATTRNKRKRQNNPKDSDYTARSEDGDAEDREELDRESQLKEILRKRRTSNQRAPRTVPEPKSPKKKKGQFLDAKKKTNVVKRARSGSKSDMNSENEVASNLASDAPTEVESKETVTRSSLPRAAKRLSNVSLAPPRRSRSQSNITTRSNSSHRFPSSPINPNISEESSNSIQPFDGDEQSLNVRNTRRSSKTPQPVESSSSAALPNSLVSVVVPSVKLEDRIPKLRLHQHNSKGAFVSSQDHDQPNVEISKQTTSAADDTETKPVVGRRRKSDMHEVRQLPPSVPPVTRSHCHFIRLKFNNNAPESSQESKRIIDTFLIPQCATGNEEIKNKMKDLDIVEEDNLTVQEQNRGVRIGHDGKKHASERFDEHSHYSLSLKEEFLDFSVDLDTLNTLIELVGLSLIQEGQVEALLPEDYFKKNKNDQEKGENEGNEDSITSYLFLKKRRRTHSFDSSSSSIHHPRSRKSSPAFFVNHPLSSSNSPRFNNKRKKTSNPIDP